MEVLCEDRAHERFARQLCRAFNIAVLRVDVAPSGKGAAEAWVRKKYPELVKKRRSRSFQQNLALLVLRDGDRRGFTARKRDLDAALDEADVEARDPGERIALLVPTWSIETWLAFLCRWDSVDESQPYKNHAGYDAAVADGTIAVPKAVAGWKQALPPGLRPLPALASAYVEFDRLL